MAGRQVEPGGDLGAAGGVLVIGEGNKLGAGLAELQAGGGVDGVVHASMPGPKAAKQLIIGGVDDAICGKAGDVAPPQADSGVLGRGLCVWDGDDAAFVTLGLQKRVLATEEIRIERPGLPQVHECPKQRPQFIGCEPAQFRFAHGELRGWQEVGNQGGNEFRAGGGHAFGILTCRGYTSTICAFTESSTNSPTWAAPSSHRSRG